MEIINCRGCGKLFSYSDGPRICYKCKEKDEEDFVNVKEYLRQNRASTVSEVAEACEVTVEKIHRYLRDGRLEIADGANISLECEKCGAEIRSGRFCDNCSRNLEKEITKFRDSGIPKEQPKEENKGSRGGMKYLRSDDD